MGATSSDTTSTLIKGRDLRARTRAQRVKMEAGTEAMGLQHKGRQGRAANPQGLGEGPGAASPPAQKEATLPAP